MDSRLIGELLLKDVEILKASREALSEVQLDYPQEIRVDNRLVFPVLKAQLQAIEQKGYALVKGEKDENNTGD